MALVVVGRSQLRLCGSRKNIGFAAQPARALLLLLFALVLVACPGESPFPPGDGAPNKDGPIGGDGPRADTPIPTTCGNKTQEAGEECDDGNKDNTDACLNNCKLAFCGDGHVQKGVEQCDDGNQDGNDACSITCRSQAFQVNSVTVSDQRFPAVAVQSDGTIVVVWQDASATGDDTSGATVRLRRFDVGGKALDATEKVVPTTKANDQRDPDIAINGQDQALVVWTDWSKTGGDSKETGVRGRIVDKAGTSGGPDFLVNSTTTGPQSAPAVCATPSGGFWVAYNDTSIGGSSHGTDIRVRQVSAAGQPQGSDKQINTSDQGDQMWADCATSPGGDVLVVWQTWSSQDKDSSDIGIAGRIVGPTGSMKTSEILINAITSGRQENPNVALDGSEFVVVWEDGSKKGADKDMDGVQMRRVSTAGKGSAQEEVVNTTTTGDQQYPAVAAAGGLVAVVWQDGSNPAQGLDVRSRRYQGGSPLDTSDTVVNTSTPLDQARPAVTVATGGQVVVVWEATSTTGDNAGYGIRMRIINP
jgi:cysteine-rich repeat protein